MKPRIKVLTLGVKDIERSLVFYRDGLGLPTKGIVGKEHADGAVAFFDLEGGLILALFPVDSLAKDAGIAPNDRPLGVMSIGHIAKSKEAVDAIVQQAERAGATVTDRPRDRFWGGYSGYFHDPDGHLWEIIWNPDFPVAD